jgi:hypothetical protein
MKIEREGGRREIDPFFWEESVVFRVVVIYL